MSSRNGDSRHPVASSVRGAPNGGAHPTVSVVLPTYQREALIARSVKSVLQQTYEDFELIIVDDGSTDGSADQVARFDDPRIRYLRLEENRGAAAARNAGIRQGVGGFFAFQDSDDEWLPNKLECHMRAFAACDPNVGVVYSDMYRIQRDGTSCDHLSPDVVPGVLIDPSTGFYQVCKLGIQSAVIRRECFAAVGGFDEAFPVLEDLELFVRLSQRYPFHHLRVPLVNYYETDGLSKNMPAKLIARALLLRLYHTELERSASWFVASELSTLRAARRPEEGAASDT